MNILPIKTRLCTPPQDDLTDIYRSLIPRLNERVVVAISSKIVAIEEGRCIAVGSVESKDELIARYSELCLPRERTPGRWVMHTITNGVFIPSAGIDESNANASAERICQFLRRESGLKNIGVVITDSHSIPLRRGVVGAAIGYWGFESLRDYRGEKDLFDRDLKVSQANLPDGFAAAAVLVMGEGAEQTPIALISEIADSIKYIEGLESDHSEKLFTSYSVAMEEDLYYSFLGSVRWEQGGKYKR